MVVGTLSEEITVDQMVAMNLGELAAELRTRNEIDKRLYELSDKRDQRMEKMMKEQQAASNKLVWALFGLNAVLATGNVLQFMKIVG